MPVTRGPPACLQRRAARAAQSNQYSELEPMSRAMNMHARHSAYHSHQALGRNRKSPHHHQARFDAVDRLPNHARLLLHIALLLL